MCCSIVCKISSKNLRIHTFFFHSGHLYVCMLYHTYSKHKLLIPLSICTGSEVHHSAGSSKSGETQGVRDQGSISTGQGMSAYMGIGGMLSLGSREFMCFSCFASIVDIREAYGRRWWSWVLIYSSQENQPQQRL